MAKHLWLPVDADIDDLDVVTVCYQNERGDAHIHSADCWLNENSPRLLCWSECSGDWPGCIAGCPMIAELAKV